ncbi:hypothetical protein HDU97_007018 [Phlyctochytrium planicorne]|nr:hypothetical protein HDU97_007018 [Phlyctochytrium planicorne]
MEQASKLVGTATDVGSSNPGSKIEIPLLTIDEPTTEAPLETSPTPKHPDISQPKTEASIDSDDFILTPPPPEPVPPRHPSIIKKWSSPSPDRSSQDPSPITPSSPKRPRGHNTLTRHASLRTRKGPSLSIPKEETHLDRLLSGRSTADIHVTDQVGTSGLLEDRKKNGYLGVLPALGKLVRTVSATNELFSSKQATEEQPTTITKKKRHRHRKSVKRTQQTTQAEGGSETEEFRLSISDNDLSTSDPDSTDSNEQLPNLLLQNGGQPSTYLKSFFGSFNMMALAADRKDVLFDTIPKEAEERFKKDADFFFKHVPDPTDFGSSFMGLNNPGGLYRRHSISTKSDAHSSIMSPASGGSRRMSMVSSLGKKSESSTHESLEGSVSGTSYFSGIRRVSSAFIGNAGAASMEMKREPGFQKHSESGNRAGGFVKELGGQQPEPNPVADLNMKHVRRQSVQIIEPPSWKEEKASKKPEPSIDVDAMGTFRKFQQSLWMWWHETILQDIYPLKSTVEERLTIYFDRRKLPKFKANLLQLLGLSISAVISGEFSGWNNALLESVLCLAEMALSIPVLGGTFGFCRAVAGDWMALVVGNSESMEYIMFMSLIFVQISDTICELPILQSSTPILTI